MGGEWPVELRGLTESVVTTRGPEGRWNVAALGLQPGEPVTARTWGETRTRQNFDRAGGGVVQFTRDPVTFVEAALAVREVDEPVLETADAWVEVTVERLDAGRESGTEWVDWGLRPEAAAVERKAVPTIERGFNAVVEATVDASRLDIAAYDRAALEDRLAHHRAVVERCGSARDRQAMRRLDELVGE
jgi:hypothetical protein